MRIALTIVLLLACNLALAETFPAASCSSTDIQAAINLASDGDIVTVPPCATGNWAGDVNIPNTKGITLQGAGRDNTKIDVSGVELFIDTLQGNSPVRVTGFEFNNIDNPGSGWFVIVGDATDWRVDNNRFDHGNNTGSWGLTVGNKDLNDVGYTYGVIDNNIFIGTDFQTFLLLTWQHSELDGPVLAGDYVWTLPQELGTDQAVFIEDNDFNVGQAVSQPPQIVDTFFGAKYVLRYNNIHNAWITTHSQCTSGGRDPMSANIYKNVMTDDANAYYAPIHIRSVSGFIYDNDYAAGANAYSIIFDHERSYRECFQITKCDGTEPLDENRPGELGWRCIGQPGWGPPQDNEVVNPSFAGLFFWDNDDAGVNVNATINTAGEIPDGDPPYYQEEHMVFGREVFNEADMTIGPISGRPSTCSYSLLGGRDIYISTDENVHGATVYQCSATNVWTKHWEPYTYPHPLRQEQSEPPLTITYPKSSILAHPTQRLVH